MTAIFDATHAAFLSRPHVARAWLARLDLPSGIAHLHSGVGRVSLYGETWSGIGDPTGARMLSLGEIVEPRFGAAAALTIVLSGVDAVFFKSVWTARGDLEGRAADVWFQIFDPETATIACPRVKLFPKGRITSPKLAREGLGKRTVSLTIESIWAAKNFAPGGRWSPADQKRRFPGDKGLDFVGVDITEQWQ